MKVCLINPASPFLIDDTVFPPLGLFYLSSYLRKYGHDAVVCDLAIEEEVPEDVDAYGITATSPQFKEAVSIAKQLKKLNKPIILGGAHATITEVVEDCFDVIVKGEGERAIVNFAFGRVSARVIISNPIRNLDEIPFPDRRTIKNYNYFLNGKRATSMITTRGCPFSCAFCCKATREVRVRSSRNVALELEELKRLGFNGVMFYDDVFCLYPKRVENICFHLKRLGFVWRCFVRANLVTFDLLKLMKESGCVEIGLGVESGSQRILNIIDKKTTVEQNDQVAQWCKALSLSLKAFLIVGLPGENKESLIETERWLARNEPDDIDVTLLEVYPNSDIWNHPYRYDIKFKKRLSWYKGKPNEYTSSVRTKALSSKQLVKFRQYLEDNYKRRW